jgi:4a-hydroxytetrahydrobiopterin dehydratase
MSKLTEAEVAERLSGAGEWRAVKGEAIERELRFADFAAALAFVNRVGELAEASNHHPDIQLYGWNKVRLELSTHSEGGLTDADFRLASEIDQLS